MLTSRNEMLSEIRKNRKLVEALLSDLEICKGQLKKNSRKKKMPRSFQDPFHRR